MKASVKLTGTIAVALWMLVTAVTAQPATPPVPAYRLTPGDVLEIVVVGEPELSIVAPRVIDVLPDGAISFPHVGRVKVEGLLVEEAGALLAKGLRDAGILVNPQITVSVVRCNIQKITVIGAVRLPGMYPHIAGMTVREAVAQAGGLDLPGPERKALLEARVVHVDGTVRAVDLDRALRGEGKAEDISLQPGDMLFIDLQMSVYVLGYVTNPGVYAASQNMHLTAALALAGGAKEPEGDLQNVRVTRAAGGVTSADLRQALAGESKQDLMIEPGDVIYVPQLLREATLLGYVNLPGKYVFASGDRVSELVAQGRGALDGEKQGDLTKVTLLRLGSGPRVLNLQAALAGQGKPEDNPVLQPGDQVVVPEADNRVVVTGYVVRPGVYNFRAGERVSVALGQAGGVAPGLHTASTIVLKRGAEEPRLLNVSKDDPQLEPGDQIVVSLTQKRVAVLGFVAKAGLYECQDGQTVMDMLAQAEGLVATRQAGKLHLEKAASTISLYRRDGDSYLAQKVDISRFLTKGDAKCNPVVQPGDIIYVPGTRKVDLGEILRSVLVIPNALGD